jgi:hypothetical protein
VGNHGVRGHFPSAHSHSHSHSLTLASPNLLLGPLARLHLQQYSGQLQPWRTDLALLHLGVRQQDSIRLLLTSLGAVPRLLTCQRAARSWPRPAGRRKRSWYRAKACSQGVAACAIEKRSGQMFPPSSASASAFATATRAWKEEDRVLRTRSKEEQRL